MAARLRGCPSEPDLVLFGAVSICLLWMHVVVIRMAQTFDRDPAYSDEPAPSPRQQAADSRLA